MSKEIKPEIKNLPKNRSPGADSFTGECHQKSTELTSILLKLFQKTVYSFGYSSKLILQGQHYPDMADKDKDTTKNKKL